MLLGELLQLADDDALSAECLANLEALILRLAGLRRRVPGDFDEREAILTIETASYEGTWLAERLLRRYVKQAAERDMGRAQVYYHFDRIEGLSAAMRIGGPGAFGYLKGERGVHRLAREGDRPAADARVEILAVAVSYDEIRIEDHEVKATEWRETSLCGGPLPYVSYGVRLTHSPTGIQVDCRGQGATHLNRTGAWTLLRSRLLHLRHSSDESAPLPVRNHNRHSLWD